MSLSLLAPLALLAGFLVGVPIFLHLIDQRKVPVLRFPALRFLLQAQKRLRKQSRVRDLWLLLVRILGLLLLVFAAAAPVVKYQTRIPAGAELQPSVVFLLDRSLSMGYRVDGDTTLFDRARARMDTVAALLPEGTRVGLLAFDRYPEDLVGGLTQDRRRLKDAAREAELTYAETDLRAAILAGVRTLLGTPEGGGDLYLLTDLTEASLPGDQALELPFALEGKIRLVVADLGQEPRSNRAVAGVEVGEGDADGSIEVTARVRGEGAGSVGEVALDLFVGDEALSRGYVELTAEGTQDKPFHVPGEASSQGPARFTLQADALPADDTFYFQLDQRRDLRALIIDGEPGTNLADGESFFLERALSPKADSGSRITPIVMGPSAVPRLDPREQAVVFLLNVSDPAPLAAPLQAYVEAGGALFIAVGDNVSPERYNRALRELLPASLGETIVSNPDVTGDKPPSLAYPPVGHPVFQVFREAGTGVFGATSFFKVIPTAPSLKEGADVLLKLSTGLPILLSRSVGRGRVFFFASSLDRAWNDMPLKSIYLPFVQESVHFLARNPVATEEAADLRVGQPVPFALPPTTGRLTVLAPDGKRLPVDEVGEASGDDALSRRVLRLAPLPGHYRVEEAPTGDGAAGVVDRGDLAFAVNVPEAETHLTRLDVQRLRKVLPALTVVVEGQGGEGDQEVTVERENPLARALLWGLLVFLLVEGVLSLRRRTRPADRGASQPPAEAPPSAAA